MQELEDLEGLGVVGRGAEQEQLVLDYRVEERRRVSVGKVYERGARRGMREVQWEEGAARGRAACVGLLEEGCAAAGDMLEAILRKGVGTGRTCAHRRCREPLSSS